MIMHFLRLTFGVVIDTLHKDGVFGNALGNQQDALLEPMTTEQRSPTHPLK